MNSLRPQEQKKKFSVVIQSDTYKNLINNTLGDKEIARQFIADISTVVSNNPTLSNCQPASILSAGLMAQSLKLSLTGSLGFAYIVPYGDKAQFQIGWKGLVQLAQRSGQFKRLGVREVHEGEYIGQDNFGDDLFKFDHKFDANAVVGYFAYFELLNGFQKTMYWTKEQCEAHAKKYSRSYGSGKSTDLWKNSFDQMACKTVLKLLLNRYAPLSVDLQRAVLADQAIINNDGKYEYVDAELETNDVVDTAVKEKEEVKEEKVTKKTRTKAKEMKELDELAAKKKAELGIEKSKDIVAAYSSYEKQNSVAQDDEGFIPSNDDYDTVAEDDYGMIDEEGDSVEEDEESYSDLGGIFK